MMSKKIVILSAFHDYRTPKRASIQPLADAFIRLGYSLSFLSTRFSWLSRWSGDSRNFLNDKANKMENIESVGCYLWRTTVHPFNTRHKLINMLNGQLFTAYANWPSTDVDAILRSADFIIIESSVAAIYLQRIRRLNPAVKIIYYATDRLDTHGAHPEVIRLLKKNVDLIDHFVVRSKKILHDFGTANLRPYLVPFGIHADDFMETSPSPYRRKLNAVSVGSGLFDPDFFGHVADAFPEIDFHIIGCGTEFSAPSNVYIYPEMAFRATLPYLKHATIGLAPYRWAPAADYIADSSLKLAQFEYLGKPAICPQFAAGDRPYRFAYELGNAESMKHAIRTAITHVGKVEPVGFMSWDDVAARVLHPQNYADTLIAV